MKLKVEKYLKSLRFFVATIGQRTLFAGLALPAIAYVAFRLFVIMPLNGEYDALASKTEEVSEAGIALRATNLEKVILQLNGFVESLQQKSERVATSVHSAEEIPILLTKFERAAVSAGLTVRTSFEKEKATLPQGRQLISIKMSYLGQFRQVMSFLGTLSQWPGIVAVKGFKATSSKLGANSLSGQIIFLSVQGENV